MIVPFRPTTDPRCLKMLVKLEKQMSRYYSKCFQLNRYLPDPASFDPKLWILLAMKLCPLGIDGKDYLQFHIARGTQLPKYNSAGAIKAYGLGRKIREKGRRRYSIALRSTAKTEGFRSCFCSYLTADNEADAWNQAREEFKANWRKDSNAPFRPQVISVTDITDMDEAEQSALRLKISTSEEARLSRKLSKQ